MGILRSIAHYKASKKGDQKRSPLILSLGLQINIIYGFYIFSAAIHYKYCREYAAGV